MTIDYDKPVRDFVAGLNATGHVGHSGYPTHQTWRKTSVTIHHNGGNLTLPGILQVWQVREASAHFDVDANGNVGQYVEVGEFAWATGSTEGNESSISIEMADATFAPNWTVAEATWKEAARLCGWLHAHVIGFRPTNQSVFPHQHWTSTDCPGPFVLKIFPQIIAEAQTWYDHFKGVTPNPSPSPTPTPPSRLTLQQVAQQVIDGKWGNGPDRIAKLKAAGYDPVAVQAEVNRELNVKPGTKSINQIAQEVIKGLWGNGPERVAKLKAAGYNPVTVQAEVNRLLA